MIRISPQPEASDFDARVRQPGLEFLAESGISIEMEAPANFDWKDLWRNALEDLYDDYDGICAYSCFRMEYSLGGVTTDHYHPKKKYPLLAYEWSNYRLAATRFNSRKNNHEDVLDPFDVENGWFQIDFTLGKIGPNPELGLESREKIAASIKRLKLNERRLRNKRTQLFDWWAHGEVGMNFLATNAPLIHSEIIRQFSAGDLEGSSRS